MAVLTKKEFEELANVHGARCISIFLPTHRAGQPVIEQQDKILFKNQLSSIEKEMKERGFGKEETKEFLDPAKALLNDSEFWRHQTEGLAVFLGRTFIKYFSLPVQPKPFYYFSHEFYLKPFLPLFMGDGNFFLLVLNFHEVKFFKGNRDKLDEIQLKDMLPQRMEEVVGFDYRQKFLGIHSGSGRGAQAVFHGHADWQEDEKDEILSFFRAIDKAIAGVLESEKVPLIVASLDYLFPIYRQANTYAYLYPEHISGNPEYVSTEELHRKTWQTLAFHFDKERQEKAALFNQFHDTKRATTEIRELIPAAFGGRVDTLFLDKNEEVWGIYDPRTAEVRMHDGQNLSNTSLTNLAAIQVFLNGGQVYLEERSFMPVHYSVVNALYRY